jgi:hypothetical protein
MKKADKKDGQKEIKASTYSTPSEFGYRSGMLPLNHREGDKDVPAPAATRVFRSDIDVSRPARRREVR